MTRLSLRTLRILLLYELDISMCCLDKQAFFYLDSMIVINPFSLSYFAFSIIDALYEILITHLDKGEVVHGYLNAYTFSIGR